MKIKFWNILKSIESLIQNSATSVRTWTFPDKDGTVILNNDIGTDTVPGIMKKYGSTGPNTDGTMDQNSITNAINAAVTGLYDDRGNFDASVNAYPSSGGSGTAGAIMKGDVWTVSVAGTLPTAQSVSPGDTVRALVDTPGNTQANWAINGAAAGSTVPDASTTVKGKVELLIQSEMNTGTDTTRAATAETIKNRDGDVSALTDASTIDITSDKHTLTSSAATRTFTISYAGQEFTVRVTLNAASATYTFPVACLCVSEGVAFGDNILLLAGSSGDKYIITGYKMGSEYYVVCKNFGQ